MKPGFFAVSRLLPHHPRLLDLEAEMDEPHVTHYLLHLWAWCATYAPDGRISRTRFEDVVRLGKDGFVDALIRSGFLEDLGTDQVLVVQDLVQFGPEGVPYIATNDVYAAEAAQQEAELAALAAKSEK